MLQTYKTEDLNALQTLTELLNRYVDGIPHLHIYGMCEVRREREKERESSFTLSEKRVKLKASGRLAGGLSAGFSELPRSGLLLRKRKSMTVSRPEPGQNVMESVA